MATYRIDGFQFNRANVAGLEGKVKAACIARMVARERELCTVETNTVLCIDGPFQGQTIELSEGGQTAPLSIRGWTGFYDGGKWNGTTGQPVKVIADQTNTSVKQPDAKQARGYEQLGDLLASMSEPENIIEHEGKEMAVFSIGRTVYRVLNTEESIGRLRANILKKKKCFADKFISAPRPVKSALDCERETTHAAHIEALAAQDVVQVVAMVQATAAIEQAQAMPAPEALELATVCQGEAIEGQDAPDTSHLIAIQSRISNESARLENAKSDSEKAYFQNQVNAANKELASEYEFLGVTPTAPASDADDEALLNALNAPINSSNAIEPAPAPTPAPNATPAPAAPSAAAYASDIPAALAVAAYNGTSFSPERRGASAQNDYAQTLAADYETMHAQAVKGGTLDLLPEVFARYRARQASAYRAYLASSSRCVSSFIAGPSNFPAARMNKRADIAHKRLNEYLDGGEMAKRAALRTLRPDLRAIMAGDADAVDRLAAKIASAERSQQAMKNANKAIRTHAKAGESHQVAALMELGFTEGQAVELIKPDFCGRIGFANYSLTNNNANIRRMKERLEQISKAQACEVMEIEGADGVRFEDDAPANRVRLYFPGKPAEEIRAKLKSNGFRWAPSLGAWQAYRNNNTVKIAKDLAGTACEAQPVQDAAPAAPVAPVAPVEPVAIAPTSETAAPTVAEFLNESERTPMKCENMRRQMDDEIEWAKNRKFSPSYIASQRDGELMEFLNANETANESHAADLSNAWLSAAPAIETQPEPAKPIHGASVPKNRAADLQVNPPVPCDFKVGDKVIFTNPNGVSFRKEVTGFAPKVWDFGGRFVYLDLDCWWFPVSPDSLKKINPEGEATQPAPGAPMPAAAAAAPVACEVPAIEPTPAAPVQQFQKASGKSGAWHAELSKIEGAFVLRFFSLSTGLAWLTSHYATGRERIRALQVMATKADKAAAPTPDESASSAPVENITDGGKENGALSSLEPAPAFERIQPINFDPRDLLIDGVTASQLIGLGVKYTGNAANLPGRGAITEVTDTRGEKWGCLRMVCTLEDGRIINAEPHYFTASLRPILQFNAMHHGAPYLSELAAAAMLKRSSESSAAELAQNAHAKELAALPLEFPYLQQYTQGGKLSGCTLAAANIRAMLKRAFPGVKFSVRSSSFSMGNSINVSWTDGPTDDQVSAFTDRFSAGYFDGSDDCYNYRKSAFTELFGESKYIHTRRELSDGAVLAIIAQEWPAIEGRPTLEDYRHGGVNMRDESNRNRVYLAARTWTAK